jgi:hypothetical protein
MEFYLAGLFYAEWLKGAKAYGERRLSAGEETKIRKSGRQE